ncbi:MAG: ABC transporter permease protein [Acetothermia bacterium 64_32]|nr:MAG: ABC transporter permease protein [Acetothermia bacterium 64_32]HAF71046.1 manganese ABC transporter permease [Candidatus Acetothermia bacterium]
MQALADFFVAPLAFPFMVRGLVASALVGALCAVMGTYVVLRGMAFFGDALAHAILPGVAVGYLVTGGGRRSLFWWGLGTAILMALGIGAVSRKANLKEDTAIGIVFAGMFALGIALISTVRGYTVDLSHLLFGNVLGVSPRDLVLVGAFGGGVLLAVVLFYKEFLVISFDPDLAATLRLPTGLLSRLLLVLIAVTVVVSLQAVGVALALAMLVIPAATAYLLVERFFHMMWVGAGLGALAGVLGIYLSYWTGIASGAAIVLVATGFFLLALAFKSTSSRTVGVLPGRSR